MIYKEKVIDLSGMINLITDIVDKQNTLLYNIKSIKDYDDIEYLAEKIINQYGSSII